MVEWEHAVTGDQFNAVLPQFSLKQDFRAPKDEVVLNRLSLRNASGCLLFFCKKFSTALAFFFFFFFFFFLRGKIGFAHSASMFSCTAAKLTFCFVFLQNKQMNSVKICFSVLVALCALDRDCAAQRWWDDYDYFEDYGNRWWDEQEDSGEELSGWVHPFLGKLRNWQVEISRCYCHEVLSACLLCFCVKTWSLHPRSIGKQVLLRECYIPLLAKDACSVQFTPNSRFKRCQICA